MSRDYENFESLIKMNLCDDNAVIIESEIIEKFGSQFLYVYYTISNKYAKENDLYYKNRILSILLKRGKDYKGSSIESFADVKKV